MHRICRNKMVFTDGSPDIRTENGAALRGVREMANRRGRFTIKPRFWIMLLMAACMCMTVSMFHVSEALNAQRSEIARLEAYKHELQQQNNLLKDRAEFASTDEFIERQARAQGMIHPGETRYLFNAEGEGLYAQGGN